MNPVEPRTSMSSLALVRATLCALALAIGGCTGSDATATIDARACRSLRMDSSAHHSLRWFISGDSSGRRVLDAYCAGVGPGLLEHVTRDTVVTPDTLVIVNWNMALGAGDLGALVNDVRTGRLTGFRVDHFVLLLQEAPRRGTEVPAADLLPRGVMASELDAFGNADIVTFARAQRLHILYVPSLRNAAAPQDQGNAILSTLPLRDPHVYELSAGIRRRVAVSATVAGPDRQRLRLVSVHLDNFSTRQLIGSLGAVRARQAGTLAAMLPADDALLLGGDLNTWTRQTEEAAFRILRRQLPRPETIDTRPTARRANGWRKLDYLLLRAPATLHFEERRIDERYGSDHHPLIGVLHRAQ